MFTLLLTGKTRPWLQRLSERPRLSETGHRPIILSFTLAAQPDGQDSFSGASRIILDPLVSSVLLQLLVAIFHQAVIMACAQASIEYR